MAPLGHSALFYLAAAVADFFIPSERMSQHKIQSEGGGKRLVIELEPVPKFLSRLVLRWATKACVVSFKLETDESILIEKARQSLENYQHQLVIGNLLSTRQTEVIFVTKEEIRKVKQTGPGQIESQIVPLVIATHTETVDS